MASKGLTFPIWIGWMCGVVVLKRPWGSPTLPSWLTFSTFYCLFGLFMYCFLMTDFLVNNSDALSLGEDHQFGKYVRAFAIIQYAIITFFKRVVILVNAKRLASLMEILNEYEKSHQQKTGTYMWGYKKRAVLVPLIIYSSFAMTFYSLITRGFEFLLHTAGNRSSWVKLLGLGQMGYSILYLVFAIIPLGIVSNVTNAIIIVTSLQICRMFCDFCDSLKRNLSTIVMGGGFSEQTRQDDLENYNILKMRSKLDWAKTGNLKTKSANAVGGGNKVACLPSVQRQTKLEKIANRQGAIDKFEEVKKVMQLGNEVLAGLILWMVCGMTLGTVANASQLFVTGHNSSGIYLVSDILTMVLLTLYFMLLEFGHRIGRMQRAAKLGLHKEFLNLPWSLEKDEMEDVIQGIIDYEWKLSACGFFNVNRGLASGIFSLVLNYVVILVQLNIALTETPSPVCSNNGTNSSNHSTSEIPA